MNTSPSSRVATTACALLVTFLTAAGVRAEGGKLTGDQIRSALAGTTLTGTGSRGGTWEATYAKDGTLSLIVVDSSWSDSGTWEVKGDRYCSERSKRAYRCLDVYKVSDSEFHFIDDRGQTTKAFRK